MEFDSPPEVVQETQRCIKLIKSVKHAAKVILVIGPTGAGKSSLLEDLCDTQGYSHGFGAGTQEFQICETSIEGAQYFIMDTPGFDAEAPAATFYEIVKGIQAISPYAEIVGVLYTTKIAEVRLKPIDYTILRFVRDFCGDACLHHIVFITTHWTTPHASLAERYRSNLEQLRNQWRDSSTRQVVTYQHGREYNTQGEDTGNIVDWYNNRKTIAIHAKAFVVRHYGNIEYWPLKIVQELTAQVSVPLHLTSAGKALRLSGPPINAAYTDFPRRPFDSKSSEGFSGSTSEKPQHEKEHRRPTPPQGHREERPTGNDNGSDLGDVLAKYIPEIAVKALNNGAKIGLRWVLESISTSLSPRSGGLSGSFPRPDQGFHGDSNSVVDVMKALGMDSSLGGRQIFADKNNIHAGAPGSAAQNAAIRDCLNRNSM